MLTITVDNRISLEVNQLPGFVVERIKERLTFDNPQWLENEKRGFSNWDTPQVFRYWRQEGDRLIMPRGLARQAIGILRGAGIPYQIDDRRRVLPEVDFTFTGQLKDFQAQAVEAVLSRDFGTLAAPTGSGKTVMALAVIAERRQPALIIVHTKELLNQWIDRIEKFLWIPAQEVGVIGNGKKSVGPVTVALVQTLYKCADDIAPHIGFLIVDECHRAPARTFTTAAKVFDCKYMLGLSATPWRRDGLSKLIYWYLGQTTCRIDKKDLIATGDVLPVKPVIRQTDFRPWHDPSEEYSRMLSELTEDSARNALIASDVAQEARNGGGIILILTDRKAHCEALRGLLQAQGVECALLTGDLPNGERQTIVDDLNQGRVKVLVATGQLIGEGFDCKELSTLFLATPIKFSGRLLQYLGRVLRPAPGKAKALVYDYHDINVGVLMNAAKGRMRVYEGPHAI
ncbi:MAG: DEAD/DEAH box helicase [Desulfobacteraceae bacterium]